MNEMNVKKERENLLINFNGDTKQKSDGNTWINGM